MRRKYSVEQNEEFYLVAAKTYQDIFDVRNCISPSGQVAKEVFFPAYRDRFGYGLGLFKTKEEAKRMRDGVTKFFKARFVEKMQRYTNKGMDFEQLMALVMGEFQPYLLTCDIHDAVHTFKRTLDADIQQLQARRMAASGSRPQFTPQFDVSRGLADSQSAFLPQVQQTPFPPAAPQWLPPMPPVMNCSGSTSQHSAASELK
ncbi:Hypothetical_protein [Hexamita inflata]|uniref:Hypothetical_protein n=1 Tax=Hexamita inflata TaxID=28002 RepID=A0AA86QP32_9EUKA|nr:Hypothetical protein HINF_LOCUS49730 [Hexamita inflata]